MSILISFKRVASKPSLWLMIAIISLCIILCGMLNGDDGIPDCGFVSGDDAIANEICDKLESDGLIRYSDTKSLTDAIQKGIIASGMVFADDFSERVFAADIDSAVTYYECERVMISTLYKYRTTAYILEHYVPHITSKLLKKEGVTLSPDDAAEDISKYITDNTKFHFTIESTNGKLLEKEHYSLYFSMGAVSLLLFFALSLFAVPYTEKQFISLAKRVGLKKAFYSYALSSIVFAALLFFAATAASLAVSQSLFKLEVAKFIIPTAVYILFLSALAVIATAIFGSTEKIRVPIMALFVASLAVCPVFIDIAEFLEIPEFVRHIIPAYFFYSAVEHTAVCAIVALSTFIFGCALYAAVLKKKLHR